MHLQLVSTFIVLFANKSHIWLGSEGPLGDFPGGPVVKNLPCNARNTNSIPGQGTKILEATWPNNSNISMTNTVI